MFVELKIKDEAYKLRLTTKGSVALEKALGYNPITMLIRIDDGFMPTLSDVLTILHAMLQPYNHGMTMDKVYDLYDRFIEDGHNLFDLIPLFVEVFQESGYLSKNIDNGEAEKN